MFFSRSKVEPVRYAVVGAGWFGQAAVLPAFANASENSVLAAIVSGDAEKRAALAKEYKVPAHPYEEYETLLASKAVDAVYIVTPNSEHKKYTLAAARHGVHVLCEKPLAGTVADAEEMVRTCDAAGVKLQTAYRLHFEPANLAAVEAVNDGTIGEPRAYHGTLTQNVVAGASRLDPPLQSGPLSDVGIYCINAARYLFRAEPTEVAAFAAHGSDPRFTLIPDLVSAVMRFPGDRLATFTCGFGEASVSACQVIGTKGDVRLDPGFPFVGERKLFVTVDGTTKETTFKPADQIAPEIVHFSRCIRENTRPEPDGVEGLIDMHIIDAIQRSADIGGTVVKVPPLPTKPRPDGSQGMKKPAVSEPDLVNATPPSGG